MSSFDSTLSTAASDYQESLWLVALYESEEPIQALLERLHALGVETQDASIVRVDLNDQQRAVTRDAQSQLSPNARNAITGAIIGSGVFTLVGIALYEAALLTLRGIEGLPGHAFAFALAGAALGGALGSVIVPVKKRRKLPAQAVNKMPAITSEGFLVAVKMPPELGEQSEAIARSLGAKQILC